MFSSSCLAVMAIQAADCYISRTTVFLASCLAKLTVLNLRRSILAILPSWPFLTAQSPQVNLIILTGFIWSSRTTCKIIIVVVVVVVVVVLKTYLKSNNNKKNNNNNHTKQQNSRSVGVVVVVVIEL